jgi:IS30 family transposase
MRLNNYWPPETIVAIWKRENPGEKLSHSTIYRAIKELRITGITPKMHLRRHGRKKKAHNTATIHPEHYIKDRQELINNRERLGDWEGDTVHGATGKGGIVTCADRKSRYLAASLLPDYRSDTTNKAMKQALKSLPVHSITLDNGSEFAEFKDLEEALHTTVYFAEPHSPWQRGTNENTNGLVRFFFPRGTNFLEISQVKLDQVLSLINNRPRKCLGWLSPAEIMFAKCCT